MPSLKALRKRVATVRSTQQITKAMKMVAAARLRRAQDAAERARPYAAKLTELFATVAAGADAERHALLARRDEKRIDMIVLTSDRGLCGGYNSNLLRFADHFLRDHSDLEATTVPIGKKGVEYYVRRGRRIHGQQTGILTVPIATLAGGIAADLTQRFESAETDAVYLVYNRFQSAIAQVPTVVRLLPVALPETEASVDYILEPARDELLARLLPRYIAALLAQAILEATASEHAARMTAMDNATRNAAEVIDRLTLQMNRARQATITKELMEIVGGAEALKG